MFHAARKIQKPAAPISAGNITISVVKAQIAKERVSTGEKNICCLHLYFSHLIKQISLNFILKLKIQNISG